MHRLIMFGGFQCYFLIFIVAPNIINGTFCQDKVSWILKASCQPNCTVSVNGQESETVPCGDGHVKISDADLNNKTVTIIATNPIGEEFFFPVEPVQGTVHVHK